MTENRIAILGAGRGLGRAAAELLQQQTPDPLLFLSKHAGRVPARPYDRIVELDFTSTGAAAEALKALHSFGATHVWFIAGGGPFGKFEEKEWKDHLWALQLNLIFPLQLFHGAMSGSFAPQQWVFVGSGIAESTPEVKGLAYGTSKCALRAAWECWQAETQGECDVRLYSPGYIDTGLLPPNAWPRQNGCKIHSALDVARDLISWCLDISQKNQHRTFGV